MAIERTIETGKCDRDESAAEEAERYQRIADELRTLACTAGKASKFDRPIKEAQGRANESMHEFARRAGAYAVIILTEPSELRPVKFSFDYASGVIMPDGLGYHPNYRTLLGHKQRRSNSPDK